jgi:hypothetical protein
LEGVSESFSLDKDNLIEVFEEAAKLFFYTKEGFRVAWPLTFFLYTDTQELISSAKIFVLASLPRFDVIPYYLNSDHKFSNFYY